MVINPATKYVLIKGMLEALIMTYLFAGLIIFDWGLIFYRFNNES